MREALAHHGAIVWIAFGLVVGLLVVAALIHWARRVVGHAEEPAPVREGSLDAHVGLGAAELLMLLEDAERNGAHEKLPPLHVSLGQRLLADGKAAEAVEILRKSILESTGSRHKDVHARARVLLGDVAQANGDLTTACEHWQMARALYYELKQERDHAAVESRMLMNGCPTDWVLTDF